LTSLIFKGLSIKSSKINCFAKAVKQNLIDTQLVNDFKQEHQGRCLGVEQIHQLIKKLQNIYQDNGFVKILF
jgi:hemolysin activation/secretion protein